MPSAYFFEASTETIAYVAPAADVIAFIKENPDVMFDLLSRIYRGMDGVLHRMVHLMSGNAKSRLLFELLNIMHRFGDRRSDGSVAIKFNEGDIARHSGLARETVSRTIHDLKDRKLVEIKPPHIIIKDGTKLEALLQSGL